MSANFAVLLPHKLDARNSDALAICLDCLMRNTRHDFKLLISAATNQNLYETMNELVKQSPCDWCVFMHSDMFVAPGWDDPLMEQSGLNIFTTGLLVEPGVIGMHGNNVHRDFGRKPETFRRAEFEAWASSEAPQPWGEGWYAPYMFSRRSWLENGGHENTQDSEWTQRDIDMFERWKGRGNRVIQVRSIVYHLQRWSDKAEQEAEKRA